MASAAIQAPASQAGPAPQKETAPPGTVLWRVDPNLPVKSGETLDYKGMVFGTKMQPPETMREVRFGAATLYTPKNDDRKFLGVPLTSEYYGFREGKFSQVMLTAQGIQAYNAFKAYFDAHYGPAKSPIGGKTLTYFVGDMVIALMYDASQKQTQAAYVQRKHFFIAVPKNAVKQ